jgi:hypothetical protein
MPIHKPRNGREQEAVYLDRLRQLQAEGIDVEIPEEWSQRNRALDIIIAPPTASSICEPRTGSLIYIVLVRLVSRSGLLLGDCDINTSWDHQIVLESFHDQGPVCRLGSAEFCRREVLNHRIENGLRLSRGEMVEGYILGTGLQRVPTEYGDAAVPLEIVFSDQLGHEFPAHGMVSVSRLVQRNNTSARRGTGLYGPAENQQSRELSVGEESRRRYLELLAQEQTRRATKGSPVTGDLR